MDDHSHDFEWNDIYTGSPSDLEPPDALVLQIIDDLKPGRALDVGCGAGGLVVALAERGWDVTGIDIAPRAIEAVSKVLSARGHRAELRVADATNWQPPGQFDLITDCFALPDTQSGQAKAFRAMREALAPGGSVLIKDFDASMKRLKAFARFHCPTIEELLAAFDGLEIVRAEVVETPVHHHGDQEAGGDNRWTAALLYARNTTAA